MTESAKTFRGSTLDEVLPQIRAELGPDAIILAEREGVVGGIGGFFARKCVEVEAVSREAAPPLETAFEGLAAPLPSIPARLATSAYTSAPRVETPAAPALELTFADLLAQAAPGESDLPPVPEELIPEEFAPLVAPPEPVTATRIDVLDDVVAAEPVKTPIVVDDELAVRASLRDAGFPDADADELVHHALLHARPFAPHAPLRDVVRGALAQALQTPLGWKAKRRVVVLAGTEGAGAAEVAAALCAGYARAGISVAALGLDGVRAAAALAAKTEDAAVAIGVAEDVEDVRRWLPRFGRPDLLVAIAPTVVPGDEARRARTAELLAELPAHDLHLVLPSGATSGDAQDAFDALSGAGRVKGVLPVALDEAATIGGVLSLALREKLEVRWTAFGAGRLANAVPDDLAWRAIA
jgi:flagellar biosynthesis GTPase FlhF